MKRKPLALDLFSGAGGAAIGMKWAGFEVVGVDIKKPSCYYGDYFIQADVHNLPVSIDNFDFVWASPPCQRFSVSSRFHGNNWKKHPDYIPYIRDLFKGHAYTCIENVVGAPIRPDVVLTGVSMGLPYLERRRHFETSFLCLYPTPQRVKREYWKQGKAITVTKSMCASSHWYPRKALGMRGRPTKQEVKNVMGIPQSVEMTYGELGESIPPAYSEYIAREALRQMETQ